MAKVRVAVVGPGQFARVCHIPGLRMHPQAEVVAICGRDAERSAAFAKQENIEHSFADLDKLLSADVCDAIAICTPDSSHFEISLKAIKNGKHVFCEKPLAMNVQESARMMAAAEAAGIINMVAFTFRYMHALRQVKRLIGDGLIGRPFHVDLQVYWGDELAPSSLTWRDQAGFSAAGIWGDAGSHLFDLLAYLFNPVSEVLAQLSLLQREPGFAQAETVDLAHCLANTSHLIGEQAFPISVSLQASRLSRPRGPVHELQILGSKGSLGIPLTRGNNEYLAYLPAGAETWENFPLPKEAYSDEPSALGRMMCAFVDAIIRGAHEKDVDATFRAGHYAQLALAAGIRSSKSKCFEQLDYSQSALAPSAL